MFTVECAFHLTPSGVEFRLDDDPPEDEMCELRGDFHFLDFYPSKRDLDWDARIDAIQFRALGEPWRHLHGCPFDIARNFLEKHCRADLDEAEREAALETYYGR
jgi:hypothetical protein